MRETNGGLTPDERRGVEEIRSFHRRLPRAIPGRLFPRRVDAYLLGGLRELVGNGYGQVKSIHATYRMVGGRVLVEAIEVDGRRLAGRINLSVVAGRSCQTAARL